MITYEILEEVKNKEKQGQSLNGMEIEIAEFIKASTIYLRVLENILKLGPIEENMLQEYKEKTTMLVERIGMAPYFLVKELPKEYLNSFDRTKWQAITKISKFTELDYESKKACLMLCGIFGIFEKDPDINQRTEDLKRFLQNITPEELKKYSQFSMRYDPQFLSFFIQNGEKLDQEQLTRIQNEWDKIKIRIEIKSLDNVLNYLELSSKTEDPFEQYMILNNIPKHIRKRYREIYKQMAGRTKTSIPTISGKDLNSGYTYEILPCNDPRIMRFGNKNLIPCCAKLGENGEDTMIYSAIESSARVIMVLDENGKYIAGSLVTHQIGKDGRSHVCFDSIEVNANRARIRTDEYQVTLKRIETLKKAGVLKTGSLEELQQYYKSNPQPKKVSLTKSKILKLLENASYLLSGTGVRTLKNKIESMDMKITEDDLHAIEINNKILDVYRRATEEMCQKDEKIRAEQLKNGEISRDEYNHILMKNGIFTAGRNPVSMYLGNLDKLDKKHMENLPMPQKPRSIYKKSHWRINKLNKKYCYEINRWYASNIYCRIICYSWYYD